jgi:pimeloyl-ACP methyl ester carboxylesterase
MSTAEATMTTAAGTDPSFGALKQVDAGLLRVGYAEAGPPDSPAVILLHGWPYDIHSYVAVTPLLASAGYRVIVPYLRGYGTTRFLSEATFRNGQQSALGIDVVGLMDALGIDRAIIAGFDWGARAAGIMAALWPERCRNDFAKLIWQLASPRWDFDEATFDRTAQSFDNPDHVDIVIHNYRWRLGLAKGEPANEDLERRLAEAPVITAPAITLEGDANGAPHSDPDSYAEKFTGKYANRRIGGGVDPNLPQEAPRPCRGRDRGRRQRRQLLRSDRWTRTQADGRRS